MKAQYRAMGATDEQIAAAGLNDQEAKAREGITVLQPNWPVLLLFLAVAHQWQQVIAPNGRIIKTGLDWQQCEVRARHIPEVRELDQDTTDRLWRDLNTMQHAALECMAELRDE